MCIFGLPYLFLLAVGERVSEYYSCCGLIILSFAKTKSFIKCQNTVTLPNAKVYIQDETDIQTE